MQIETVLQQTPLIPQSKQEVSEWILVGGTRVLQWESSSLDVFLVSSFALFSSV